MNKYLLVVLVGTLLTPAFAAAQATVDIDAHASTLGLGLGVAFPMTDTVSGRLGFNHFSKTINKTVNNTSGAVNYTGDLKLSSFEALADWHLFNGITHLTAGLMHNGNKFSLNSTGSYTINGNLYNAGTLTSTVEFNKVAPYLGFGWSGQAKNTGFSFKSDIGILFQGKPKSTVTSTGAVSANDLATAQATLDDDLKNFRYYPVISFGIGYAF